MAVIGRVLLMPKGDYSGTTVYNNLDWVRYDGKAWVCKADNTIGVLPDVSAPEWQLLAQDGSVTGSVAWSAVTGKPLDGIAINGGIIVDGSNNIKLDTNYLVGSNIGYDNTTSGLTATNTQDAIDEIANGGIVADLDDLNDVTITTPSNGEVLKYSNGVWINGTGGGGGASELNDLTEVTITSGSLAQNQILKYNGSQWVNDTGGGNIVPLPSALLTASQLVNAVEGALPSEDKIISAWGSKTWSNTECVSIMTTPTSDYDTIGTWTTDGTWKNTGASRVGWIWDSRLYRILSDDEVKIDIVVDIMGETAGNLYAYRVDDEVDYNGVHGGAIAIKLNSKIPANTKTSVWLTRLRTEKVVATILS